MGKAPPLRPVELTIKTMAKTGLGGCRPVSLLIDNSKFPPRLSDLGTTPRRDWCPLWLDFIALVLFLLFDFWSFEFV